MPADRKTASLFKPAVYVALVAGQLSFPFLALWGALHMHPLWLFTAAIGLTVLRFALARRSETDFALPQLIFYLTVMALAFLAISDQAYLLHPFAMSGSFALTFWISLLNGRPIIESLARLREPDLPPSAIAYTKRLTQIWLIFLILNSLVAAATAFFAPIEIWAFYNGALFYCLAGILLFSDIAYRHFFLTHTRDS